MILYVVVFAEGNVTHDYYQIPLIPILAVFIAKGIVYLISQDRRLFRRIFCFLLAFSLMGLMFGLSWREVRELFKINNPKIVEVGEIADNILPEDAKVIAPYGGDTAFLYQINRQGWAKVYIPISDIIKLGATHYVTVNMNSEAADMIRDYKTIVSTEEYVIVDLTQKKAL